MKFISLSGDNEKKFDVSQIGNKAFNIFQIKSCGFRTASGFVIPISAFEEMVRYNHALQQYENCSGENDYVKLREIIKTFSFSDEFLNELKKNVSELGYPLIVRSSSSLEDTGNSSMAGMYLSVGDIRDEEALYEAIKDVWASAFYNKCEEHKPLAILVQKYHKANLGGVVFSQNPWGRGLFYGEFAFGGAEKTVNGEENTGFELGKDYADDEIPEELKGCANELYETVSLLQQRLGYDVDVEWLIDGQGLMILQVRPITVLQRRKKVKCFTIVDSEDVSTLDEIDMSDFYSRYMKWYDKRMRLRTICKKNKIHLPIVKYVFYTNQNLNIQEIYNAFPTVEIFKIESTIGIRTMKRELVEPFLRELYKKLQKESVIVRIQEITKTEFCGNSCIMSDGRIYIECMPGGFGGFLTGELDFSRYILDEKYQICQKDILEYDTIWKFTDSTNRFEKTKLSQKEKGALRECHLKEIVDMTVAISSYISNAKLEFEVSGDHVYFNDATLEKEDFKIPDVTRRIISKGDFSGNLCMMSEEELDEMKKHLGTRSVIAESSFLMKQEQYIKEKQLKHAGKQILAAPYPDPCLSVLIPYYSGFVFSRGGALSHLAIILREQKRPAIVDDSIYQRLSGTWIEVRDGEICE